MSRANDPNAPPRAFEAEQTEAGAQTLVPGVAPVTLGERLGVLANHGLFDTNARNQLEMF
ncbi:MAG: hypothetical protein WBA51_11855 [Erythrobacter sp.]